MNHNIEQFGDQAAFVSANGISAWHQLGTVFEGNLDTETALKIAYLTDWNVRKSPLVTTVERDGFTTGISVPDKFAVLRDNPFRENTVDVLGVVGNYYLPIQNEEHAALLNALRDESNGHIETAGSLEGGKKTFLTIKLPDALTIGQSDKVDLFITATNSHDGSSNFEFLVSPIRVVCANTLSAAFATAKSRFGVRHTANAGKAIQQARESLGLTWKYVEEFEKEAQALYARELTDVRFEEIVKGLYPEPEKEGRGKTLWTEKFDALVDIYHNDDTQSEVKGSAWGGYQAVTRYLDHVAPVSGEKNEKEPLTVEQILAARADRTATDMRFEKIKNDAFKGFANA